MTANRFLASILPSLACQSSPPSLDSCVLFSTVKLIADCYRLSHIQVDTRGQKEDSWSDSKKLVREQRELLNYTWPLNLTSPEAYLLLEFFQTQQVLVCMGTDLQHQAFLLLSFTYTPLLTHCPSIVHVPVRRQLRAREAHGWLPLADSSGGKSSPGSQTRSRPSSEK